MMKNQEWPKEPWADIHGFDGVEIHDPRTNTYRSTLDPCDGRLEPSDIALAKLRAITCVNALAGIPNPDGIPFLVRAVEKYLRGIKTAKGYTLRLPMLYALHRCGISI